MKWFSYRFVPYCHDPVPAAIFPAASCKRLLESRVITNLTVHKC